jgi:hypothetical protein
MIFFTFIATFSPAAIRPIGMNRQPKLAVPTTVRTRERIGSAGRGKKGHEREPDEPL